MLTSIIFHGFLHITFTIREGDTMEQKELFPTDHKKKNYGTSIGNGYSLKWISKTLIMIYLYEKLTRRYEIKKQIDKRHAAVELVLECGVTKCRLAEALNISRQSLDNWIATYKKSGLEGLVNSYKGSIKNGRTENANRLPVGNKARQLEEERKRKRELQQAKQLEFDFKIKNIEEEGDNQEQPDLFENNFEYTENRYAGGFIYLGILQHSFNFIELCSSYLGKFSEVILIFFMMLVHGIQSLEQLKTVYKKEFGIITGIRKLYSRPIIKEMLYDACIKKKAKQLLVGFFKRQARRGIVCLAWLYIDGHFIPYYGKEKVQSGFYTQRDQMMPGQTAMYVHDCNGKVVYFDIQEGKGDLKEMMHRMSEEWSQYLSGSKPLIIVDRESWGVKHFISLKGYRFVTWEKFTNKAELNQIEDEKFGESFSVNKIDYQAFEHNKIYNDNEGNSIELRRIVIWNKKSDTRVACVTFLDESDDTISIATAMLGRWGCSENSFKHMGVRCNMHYNPVQDTSKESEKQTVKNPLFFELKAKMAKIKKRIRTIEANLGRIPITTKKDGTLRTSKRRDKLKSELSGLKNELEKIKAEFKDCPEQLNIDDIKDGWRKIKVIDTEGKNLWDLAQAAFWNTRKILISMFSEYIPNNRNTIPVLEAITKCKGWIKSTPEAIYCRLEPLDNTGFRLAQIQLCRKLNELEIRLPNGKRIFYDVARLPKNCPKK